MHNARFSRVVRSLVLACVCLLCIAACSRTSDSTTSTRSDTTSTTSGTNPGQGASSVPVSAAHPLLPVQEISVSLQGNQQTILADARGFALYFYLPDTPRKTACVASCAVTWPPFLAQDSRLLKSTSPLPGTLTVQQTTNGDQVEYNHHLLYTYLGDSAPHQVTGNGVDSWYVATPDLTPPAA